MVLFQTPRMGGASTSGPRHERQQVSGYRDHTIIAVCDRRHSGLLRDQALHLWPFLDVPPFATGLYYIFFILSMLTVRSSSPYVREIPVFSEWSPQRHSKHRHRDRVEAQFPLQAGKSP